MLKKIKLFFQCKVMQCHNWTSAAQEGFPPTQEQVDSGINGFKDYAVMYCKDCGKISKLSHELWK